MPETTLSTHDFTKVVEIVLTDLSRLNNGAHFQFIKNVSDRLATDTKIKENVFSLCKLLMSIFLCTQHGCKVRLFFLFDQNFFRKALFCSILIFQLRFDACGLPANHFLKVLALAGLPQITF